MQRPAIFRLLECHSAEKFQEILNEELLDQEGQVDFYEIGEQMDKHELWIVGSFFSGYILQNH